jgi:hypothetical protein
MLMNERELGSYLLEHNTNLGQMKTIRKKLVLWLIKLFNKITNHFCKDPIQEEFIPKTELNNDSIPGLNDKITHTSRVISGLHPMISTRVEHSVTLFISAIWSF